MRMYLSRMGWKSRPRKQRNEPDDGLFFAPRFVIGITSGLTACVASFDVHLLFRFTIESR